jgi:4'-phosphopantetheinyl transferase
MSNLELLWSLPPDHRQLNEADVHVWAANLDKLSERFSPFERSLSRDERDRAMRFHFERDRSRFIAGRGLLREVLSSYLKIEPARLQFAYGPSEKPILKIFPRHRTLHFNLAHSNDLILIALTRACAIGIDVEKIRPIPDPENLARHFSSPSELLKLMTLPREKRLPAFFNLWTRKEAYIKATGNGLSDVIKEVEVSFFPGEPARLAAISGNTQVAADWTLVELNPAAGFKAAFAASTKSLQLSCWQWHFSV